MVSRQDFSQTMPYPMYDRGERLEKRLWLRLSSRPPTTLHGDLDFPAWQDAIKVDASIINALPILEGETTPSDASDDVSQDEWSVRNEILYDRLLSTFPHSVMDEFHDLILEDSAAHVYSRLVARYQRSQALTRLQLLERLFAQRASNETFIPCPNNYRRWSQELLRLYSDAESISALLVDVFLITFRDV